MTKRAKDVLGRPDWIVGIASVGTESVGIVSASRIKGIGKTTMVFNAKISTVN